ncbi:fimbrial protein [Dryocola sp. BD613]|uniref:fimbrial protein n=1 Tax=Dryocola sp. BD613 TaxID=3133272 RepID=UPI003F4FDE5C
MFKLNGLLFVFVMALASVTLPAQAVLKCGTDSPFLNNSGLNFNTDMPNGINASAPVGTILYRKDMEISVWCGKDMNNSGSWSTEAEEIFVTRKNLSDILGSNSGLTVYVTINGDRGTSRKAFGTGIKTTTPWIHESIDNSYLDRVTVNVTVELVKTGENNTLNAKVDTVLFDIGDAYDGSIQYFMKGAKKLTFTTQTCEVKDSGNFSATLDSLSINNIRSAGPIETPSRDFMVSIICNSDLWSTQNILMKITGDSIPEMTSQGLFHWKNINTGENAKDIALQLLQGANGANYIPVVPGEDFIIGNFEKRLKEVTIPLRARYYATGMDLSAGDVQAVLFYNIDYK